MIRAGIDFGAKMAGTTAIAIAKENKVLIRQSLKNQDADLFLKTVLGEYKIDMVFIDAPLSLPLVYRTKNKTSDFFYRECDKICGAMSPMFLGGLTARAMKLRHELPHVNFMETYPAILKRTLNLHFDKEKRNNAELRKWLRPFKLTHSIINQHQFDALCALVSLLRWEQNLATTVGNLKEGQIIY